MHCQLRVHQLAIIIGKIIAMSQLRNERIHWFSDNQNVVRILNVGIPPRERLCYILHGSLQHYSHLAKMDPLHKKPASGLSESYSGPQRLEDTP